MKKRKRTIAPPKTTANPGASSSDCGVSHLREIRLSGQKIANLYPSSDIPERTVTSILQRAGVDNIRHKGYALIPATDAVIAFYKRGFEQRDVAGESDRARKNKAEADSAEMDAMLKAGDCIPLAAAKLFWSEARIEIKQKIERAAYLTPTQRTKLLAELATLRKKQPETE